MSYYVGSLVRCSVVFTNAAGSAVDPTTVVFTYLGPGGQTDSYTYGTDVELVRASTGNYYVDVSAFAAGTWQTRCTGAGTVGQAAVQDSFEVLPLNV